MSAKRSSGWTRLSDREIAEWVNDAKEVSPPLATELAQRGMVVSQCSQCGYKQVKYNHDYICFFCRVENDSPIT